MADKPQDKNLFPSSIPQNPSSLKDSQDRKNAVRSQVDRIMSAFMKVLPSNLVSQVSGPFYSLQFQSAAEEIADFQITAQEMMADAFTDYTRPEYLWQIIGSLVFPDAKTDGWPDIEGDLSYRDFLQRMVLLLLQGARPDVIKDGIELLTDATVEVIERGIEARKLKGTSAWKGDDQFTFEINISEEAGTVDIDGVDIPIQKFPSDDPFKLARNVQIVLRALKPGHTLYDYRHLFYDSFQTLFTDTWSYDFSTYHYQDFRRFWLGAKSVTGTAGETLVDKTLFTDTTRDFTSIQPGAILTILDGPNSLHVGTNDGIPVQVPEDYTGNFRVDEILFFPVGDDSVPRAYTTSPTLLTGTATVVGDELNDPYQNWANAVEGETLTFTAGPNSGSYRLKTVAGVNGGPVGFVTESSTKVKIAPSILRLSRRMAQAAEGQTYQVDVDRLGVQTPRQVEVEDASVSFIGSSGTRDYIMTQRGPLTKDWGDGTPATKQDVEVSVDGSVVAVSEVNPYLGKITLATPIALSTPPPEVKVNYYWMATPMIGLAGLNTSGLVLNQWDRQAGHTMPANHGQPPLGPLHTPPQPPQSPIAEDDEIPTRFPMGIVLGPIGRPAPLQIGHRYIGFERDASSLLNDPTSMVLNQNPFQTAEDDFERTMTGETVAYEGTEIPVESSPIWLLEGQDNGYVDVGLGTYTLIDALPAEFEPDLRTVTMYHRETDLTFPAAATLAARFIVEDYTLEGVFTGIGFGLHDNHNLYQVGLLVINGVRHLGVLSDPKKLELREAWILGPTSASSVSGAHIISINTDLVPLGFQSGMQFQIFDHAQAGVYTATSVVHQCEGSTTITVEEAFPADFKLWDQDNPEVVFEVRWDEHPLTYCFVADLENEIASLEISGEISATAFDLNGVTNPWPVPSESALVLDTSGTGQAFWGSLSYLAANQTKWSFFRYGITPDFTTLNVPAIVVQTEMGVIPQDNPDYPWFTTQSFGTGVIDQTGDTLLLKSPVASETLEYTFGFSRLEPFMNEGAGVDVRAEFRLDSGVLGSGDAELVINNGTKEVRLATLLYAEGYSGTEYRRLFSIPTVTMAGLQDPDQQDWEIISGSDATVLRSEYDLIITQGADQTQRYRAYLDLTDFTVDSGYRIVESQIGVDDYTADSSDLTGIFFQADIGPTHSMNLRLKAGTTPTIQMLDLAGTIVHEYDFDWTDEETHTYRVVGATGALSVFVDDVLMLPTLDIALFSGGSGTNTTILFGATSLTGISSTVRWRTISYHPTPAAGCFRTVGIWNGGEKDHINSWEIPRIDTSTAPNSAQVGPSVVEMDWLSDQEFRLLLNPDWGVTMYRPDLSLPPYYQPESDVVGTGFINQTNEPSAGWINLQYSQLPDVDQTFGSIEFGSFDTQSVTQQRWSWVRYRIFKALTNDFIAPQHMILNYANVITSGELTKDITMENVIVQTIDTRRVSLLPTHLYAEDIYKIVDEGTIYTRESWTFDPETQLIMLGQDANYNDLYFSGEHVPVTIIFQAGKPVTTTYLENQPLADSVTRLNEGTPPIPLHQSNGIDKEIIYRDLLNDPYDPTDTSVMDNPYRVLEHEVDAETLYESMQFMEISNGGQRGLIKIAGEGTLPEGFSGYSETEGKAVGAYVLETSGTKFNEKAAFPKPEPFEQGGGSPGQTLFCSGGDYMGPTAVNIGTVGSPVWVAGVDAPLGGVLGPGSAILNPNFPSENATRGKDEGKVNRSTEWYMRIDPLTETIQWPLMDNTPPSGPPEDDPNINGTPNPSGDGACLAVLTGGSGYSEVETDWWFWESLVDEPGVGYLLFPGTLTDGTQVTIRNESLSIEATFTARAIPVGPNDFGILINPNENLAEIISGNPFHVPPISPNPVISPYVTATATMVGMVKAVKITAVNPITITNILVLETSDPNRIGLSGVVFDGPESGSLGGDVLPPGVEVSFTIYAATGV